MSKSEKESSLIHVDYQQIEGHLTTSSENYCKSAVARKAKRTLTLKKCIRPVNAEHREINKLDEFHSCSVMRHVDIPVDTTKFCEDADIDIYSDIPKRIYISSVENSIAESVDFFIDGQNFFHTIKKLYGYKHLNVDVLELCKAIAYKIGKRLGKIRFYTGISSPIYSPHWAEYWINRIEILRKDGIKCFSTDLRYIDGRATEKGVDVMIALDILERSMSGPGTIIIMSQDNDLAIAASRAKEKARESHYDIEVASAFPVRDRESRKGITGTTEFRIDRLFYDKYLEKEDSRCQHMRDHHEGFSRKNHLNFSNRDSESRIH